MIEKIKPNIDKSWADVLSDEFNSTYFIELKTFLKKEKQNHVVFPPGPLIFSAFNNTPFDKVKVVIIGQDPYHNENQANGLCFSVNNGIKKPPSLVNILKELNSDIGCSIPESGNLLKWAQQGVLLLNAIMTVRAHQAGSHQNKGWERFTDAVIKILSEKKRGLVFILWGNYAQAKQNIIDNSVHYILKAAHPSPLSAYNGFFGCKHFSKANELLLKQNIEAIDWNLA